MESRSLAGQGHTILDISHSVRILLREIEHKWKRVTLFNKLCSFRLCPFQYILLNWSKWIVNVWYWILMNGDESIHYHKIQSIPILFTLNPYNAVSMIHCHPFWRHIGHTHVLKTSKLVLCKWLACVPWLHPALAAFSASSLFCLYVCGRNDWF